MSNVYNAIRHRTPLGDLLLASDGTTLTLCLWEMDERVRTGRGLAPHFVHEKMSAAAVVGLLSRAREDGAAHGLLARAAAELDGYFAGTRRTFSVPLGCFASGAKCSAFITAAYQLPYGQTATYGQLARLAGHPLAARAAGNAMARNPLCLFVPCHRVLPASGGVGHYAGGDSVKARLLALEHGTAAAKR